MVLAWASLQVGGWFVGPWVLWGHKLDLVWLGCSCHGLMWLGHGCGGLTWLDSGYHDLVWLGLGCHGPTGSVSCG